MHPAILLAFSIVRLYTCTKDACIITTLHHAYGCSILLCLLLRFAPLEQFVKDAGFGDGISLSVPRHGSLNFTPLGQAAASGSVTNWQIWWAAVLLVLTAHGILNWAAAPLQADGEDVGDAAACGACWALGA